MPPLIKSFLLRALLIFIVWQSAYYFILKPIRFPDSFLTNTTAYSTSKLVSLFYDSVTHEDLPHIRARSAIVKINNHKIVSIADPCNALDIYVLYISFLFCFPGNWKLRLQYTLLGIVYIFVLNTIRCGLIVWLNIHYRGWVEISHHYIFTTALYLLVFQVWVLYSKKALQHVAK